MALGPGKYDAHTTTIRESTKVDGVVVMVFGGDLGNGFSIQVTPKIILDLPRILRYMADSIEQDNRSLFGGRN